MLKPFMKVGWRRNKKEAAVVYVAASLGWVYHVLLHLQRLLLRGSKSLIKASL